MRYRAFDPGLRRLNWALGSSFDVECKFQKFCLVPLHSLSDAMLVVNTVMLIGRNNESVLHWKEPFFP